jgi:hypothetical protein
MGRWLGGAGATTRQIQSKWQRPASLLVLVFQPAKQGWEALPIGWRECRFFERIQEY